MIRTPLCDSLGVAHPIFQAPIGSATCSELAAAVCNAGAVGMLAGSWLELEHLRDAIRETRALTDRPFGVNLVLEWPQMDRLGVALEEGVRVVSFAWGDPAPYLAAVHQAHGLVLHTVGSVAEAEMAAAVGVDVVVAQGWEAGGHVRGDVAMSVLVPAVCDAVAPVPVIAAGGIADGRGIAAALTLGADGVWVGTRFLATREAHVHPRYQEALLTAGDTATFYGRLFDVGWPNAPHRVLRNATVQRWLDAGSPEAPMRPGEGDVIVHTREGRSVVRYSDTIPVPGMTGDVAELALYAGQSAALVRAIQPAGEVVQELVDQAELALRRLSPQGRSSPVGLERDGAGPR